MIANPVTHYLAIRIVEGHLTDLAPIFVYPSVGSILMAASVLGLQQANVFSSPLVTFVAAVLVGIVVYTSMMVVVERYSRYDLRAC